MLAYTILGVHLSEMNAQHFEAESKNIDNKLLSGKKVYEKMLRFFGVAIADY